ncbi:MAG: ATP-binding cassette domain-containing protein [Coriobacteriales bacterium]|jgi:ABC-2 type transport system ATP-binding protein|nr:ATP-binding cassette domain-containing protein [Coriobacteriales bacterium]
MSEAVLRTTQLTKLYGAQRALDGVSLTLPRGAVYGLVGQNGAGKTTLIRQVTGLSAPTQGQLELFGEHTTTGLRQARRRLGCTIETPAFYPNLSAADNLECLRRQRGIPGGQVVANALQQVNLAGTGSKRFRDFSLGMKQRLGLAAALMGNPDLLLLDEPINGLDPMGIVEIREFIKQLAASGITILISSHILSELAQVATCYGFIHRGRLLLETSAAALAEHSRSSLRVLVSDAAQAALVLERSLGVHDYQVLAANELRVYAAVEPGLLSQALFAAGITITGLEQTGASLEDFFSTLIAQADQGLLPTPGTAPSAAPAYAAPAAPNAAPAYAAPAAPSTATASTAPASVTPTASAPYAAPVSAKPPQQGINQQQ